MANNHLITKKRKLHIEATTPDVKSSWPAWFYHPKTGVGKVFNSEDEVPNGWLEHYNETTAGKKALARAEDEQGGAGSVNTNERLTGTRGQELGPLDDEDADDDEDPEVLEDIDELTVPTLKARLVKRNVEFPARADKQKLYDLLSENWAEGE